MNLLRKSLWMLAILLTSSVVLVSCDDDDDIGYDITGTWYGDLQMYYGDEAAIYSEIYFHADGGLFSWNHGTGYEIDYYSRRNIRHDFDWEIQNEVIYLTFDERDLDCRIVDYRVRSQHFSGYIQGIQSSVPFDLTRTRGSYDRRYYNDERSSHRAPAKAVREHRAVNVAQP